MQKSVIFILFLIIPDLPLFAIQDGEFMYGDQYWNTYTSTGSSVQFYPSPAPDPYVRINAYGNGGYAGIYQMEDQQSEGYTKAVFHISSVSVGLGGMITVGWTNEDGGFGSYYKDVQTSGDFVVECENTSYPYVTVQADSSNLVSAFVVVDEIEVQRTGTPTPTDTPTPTPTITATPTPSPDLIEKTYDHILGQDSLAGPDLARADYNNDLKIDAADIVRMIIESE